MIRHRGRTNKNDAGREFREWASLFSNGLFVMIVVYADDSGTHDEKGIQVGSREGIIGGLAAPREDWIPFCNQWQAVLTKYKVEFFHFRGCSERQNAKARIHWGKRDFPLTATFLRSGQIPTGAAEDLPATTNFSAYPATPWCVTTRRCPPINSSATSGADC